MRILITGNLGYVGPVVMGQLRAAWPDSELVGFDTGYFAHCLTGVEAIPERILSAQHFGDLREFPTRLLEGVDAVVNLAAISNDPMGNQFESVTLDINHRAGIDLAQAAKRAGVRRFIFASSCSVYGFAADGARNESSPLDPLTAYARSKVSTERDLEPLADRDFQITCLRFATACGWSDRLRLDLVLNDFVASAIAARKITILSDGTPWRPLIHVQDMARAIEWAVVRDEASGHYLVLNAGSDDWNYQVRDLARGVAKVFPGVEVSINTSAAPDRRSYRVDFARFRAAAPNHQPQVGLGEAIFGLKEGLERMRFADAEFRQSSLIRLQALRSHLTGGRLNSDLRWTS
ncbi:MAG TPA: SDR family oxidoreductase [Verrucomicrobiota bacterium]|nr:NAD-dependent epimerase [Verrucomicrobiales bacterium]HRI12749.1 SDR family oxidoreductase [Verrucomicrobiota bacterium]